MFSRSSVVDTIVLRGYLPPVFTIDDFTIILLCVFLWLIIPMAKHFVPNFGVLNCNIFCWNLSNQFSYVMRHCSVGGQNL